MVRIFSIIVLFTLAMPVYFLLGQQEDKPKEPQPGPTTQPVDWSIIRDPFKDAYKKTPRRWEKVIFLCNASGMPKDQVVLLDEELGVAFHRMTPHHLFDIIFPDNKGFNALTKFANKDRLLFATPENKELADKFLKETEHGGNADPMPALRYAFSLHPELIYFLTDRGFADNEAILKEIRELNAGNKVKINTIAFFPSKSDPSEEKKCEDFLKKLAGENNGTFTVKRPDDLIKAKATTQPASQPDN